MKSTDLLNIFIGYLLCAICCPRQLGDKAPILMKFTFQWPCARA